MVLGWLSSAVSTRSFRKPALTRINAVFTSTTNHHSNVEGIKEENQHLHKLQIVQFDIFTVSLKN